LKRFKGLKGLRGLSDLPGPRSETLNPPVDPEVLTRIQEALFQRRPIAAIYSNTARELSPIALGTKGGELHLWAYQFGGESSHKCKCFTVAKLSGVDLMQDEWRQPDDDPGPGSCIDETLQQVGDAIH
jgi:predicted DNA-binding transcriptional regulator YafY